MALTPGTKLGPYEIQSSLGAGGMGEVYRARDTRLHRSVAIKILPAAFSSDPDRLQRFQQEARVLSSLNHPNLLAIFDVGSQEGLHYLVSELLEGETLRQRLNCGPLTLRKALDHGVQLANGLANAHEKGIVHRDLKPDNIFITKDGRVKILDFGLAKQAPDPAENSVTMTAGMTEPGVILGTVGYMSPEQVRGQTSDARSDIFSFGAILYEMLAGKRAFSGDSTVETMNAILKQEPPGISTKDKNISSSAERMVRRCLEKAPEERFQSARDLSFALQGVAPDAAATIPSSPETPSPAEKQIRSVRTVALIAASCLFLGSAATWLALRAARPGRTDATTVTQVSRLTHESGLSEWPTWSPDGTLLAFSSNRSGNFEIYVRRIEGGQEVNITNDPGQDVQPAFSPDGTSIAFVSTRSSRTGLIKIGPYIGFEYRTYGGDIWVAPALGGPARRLAQDGNYPVWSPDGKKIAYVSGFDDHRSILEVPVEGGAEHSLLSTHDSNWEIIKLQLSPDGGWIIT